MCKKVKKGQQSRTIRNNLVITVVFSDCKLAAFTICYPNTCAGFTDASYLSFGLDSISGYSLIRQVTSVGMGDVFNLLFVRKYRDHKCDTCAKICLKRAAV